MIISDDDRDTIMSFLASGDQYGLADDLERCIANDALDEDAAARLAAFVRRWSTTYPRTTAAIQRVLDGAR
jgi:hypothetical protein